MNRISKINISPLLLNINKNTLNKSSSLFKVSQSTKCILNNNNSSNNNIFKINNNQIRLYSTTQQPQDPKDFNPHPGVVQPKTAFSIDLSVYKTKEKLSDLNPDHLIYQSNKETLLKFLKPSLNFQAAVCISAPLIAYANQLSFKTVLLLSVFSLWGLSFKFIGEKLGSCFAIRVYREPGSDYIKLVHVNPSLTVLKIPLADIQQSKLSEAKSPYVLLDNGAIFFFENGGILHNEEEFNYILSGEENKNKHKKLEQEEYAKFFEDSSNEDLEHANKVLDFELELIEKKLEEAKREHEQEQEQQQQQQQKQNDNKSN